MTTLLIRDIDAKAIAVLRKRAKANGRSLSAELRRVIEQEASRPTTNELLADERLVNALKGTRLAKLVRLLRPSGEG